MILKSYITCNKCGFKNQNTDYCSNCGELINVALKRRIESEKKLQKRIETEKLKKPNKVTKFLENGLQHPNGFIRWITNSIYSIWTFLAMALGALIAAVIAAAAG